MDNAIDTADLERNFFQHFLDRTFPCGGACVVLGRQGGRVQTAGVAGTTDRLVCSDARPVAGDGSWEHELLIDLRRGESSHSEATRVWITHLAPHPVVRGIWEAEVVRRGSSGEELLRINTGSQY